MIPRGLILAFQFLTQLPVPRISDVEPQELARTAVWFPVVGLVIGVVLALAVLVGAGVNAWIAALLGLLVWVAITGALHLDGLADVADALGASHAAPKRFHEVLKDPHVGSFGVVAVVLLLMSKLVVMAQLPSAVLVPALLLIPAWARWGPLVWSLAAPPPSDGPASKGMAAQFRSGQDWRPAAAYAATLGIASLWLAPRLLAALAIVPLVALYWRRRIGGMTGDCHGASVEVTETLLLALLLPG